jgi:hypothetical protein
VACTNLKTRVPRGLTALHFIVIASVIFGFASLALDLGRVQLAKTQLRIATDTTAKYSVKWVSNGATVVQSRCNSIASDNYVDGSALTYGSSNVQVGYWDRVARTFTANGRPRNAIKLIHGRSVPLALGPAIGMTECMVRSSAVSACQPQGFTIYGTAAFKNNTIIASYDSSASSTLPNIYSLNTNASVVVNGKLGDQNNGGLRGDAYLAPTATLDPSFVPTGGIARLAAPVPVPADPAWSPTANPNGVPQNYIVNANTTLPAGTYWFNQLRVNARLTFGGPASVYVNGNITMNGTAAAIVAYNSQPSNLTIYQLGNNRALNASGVILGRFIGPRTTLDAENDFRYYGSFAINNLTLKNNAEFYYDEAMGIVTNIALVQ